MYWILARFLRLLWYAFEKCYQAQTYCENEQWCTESLFREGSTIELRYDKDIINCKEKTNSHELKLEGFKAKMKSVHSYRLI